jgi:peptidoglycan/xylan/chitin deacetylase (PgdA/CDA1 family)
MPPEVTYFFRTQDPAVALTLDDGPDPQVTPQILEVLHHYGARATFFLISSRVPGNEEVLRRMVGAGHEIGNHLTTDAPSIRLSPQEFEEHLLRAHRVLAPFGPLRWFRPGSAWFNEEMLAILRKHGYRLALGSVFPLDTHLPFPAFAGWFILRSVAPGSIIVLHDGGDRGKRAVVTLHQVLPALKKRGYRVVTLTELESLASGR